MAQEKMIGYHGTTKENAESILRCGRFHDSTKENEWLGHGVYFFAYKTHAVNWTKHRRYKGTVGQVLATDLIYNHNQLLDLDNPDDYAVMEDVIRNFVTRYNEQVANIDIKSFQREQQWCFACNMIRRLKPEIGMIRYTFSMPQADYEKHFFRQTQRQICVSNHNIIQNIRTEVRLDVGQESAARQD